MPLEARHSLKKTSENTTTSRLALGTETPVVLYTLTKKWPPAVMVETDAKPHDKKKFSSISRLGLIKGLCHSLSAYFSISTYFPPFPKIFLCGE
jgi:hypothetical protein